MHAKRLLLLMVLRLEQARRGADAETMEMINLMLHHLRERILRITSRDDGCSGGRCGP